MAKNGKLNGEAEDLVNKMLALGECSTEIIAAVNERFKVRVTRQAIRARAHRDKAKIDALRQKLNENLEEHFPLANLSRRMAEYQKLFRRADAIIHETVDLQAEVDRAVARWCEQNATRKIKGKLKLTLESNSTIRECIETKVKILKQVHDALEPLRVAGPRGSDGDAINFTFTMHGGNGDRPKD